MKVVLCDDQKNLFDKFRNSINIFQIKYENKLDLIYHDRPSELYQNFHKENFDIIFMDLDFGDESEDGISWAKRIKKVYPGSIIIILTAYEERYKEGYEAKAFRFMTKPIDEKELFEYLSAAIQELQLAHSISIIRKGVPRNILVKDICYLVAQSGGSELWTNDDMYCCEESLLTWESMLPEQFFFRCHNKYMVNMFHINRFEKQIIILNSGEKLPVSRRKWKMFQLEYMKFDTMRYK